MLRIEPSLEDETQKLPTKIKRRAGPSRSLTSRLRSSITKIYAGTRSASCEATLLSQEYSNTFNDISCTKLGILKHPNRCDANSLKKKTVRFNGNRLKATVHSIQPMFQYACDLWWTREEIELSKATQADFSDVSDDTKFAAKSYLKSIQIGHNQLSNEIGSEAGFSVSLVSTDVYEGLVLGKLYGFSGLELYNVKSFDAKRDKAIEVVKLIAKTYNNEVFVRRKDGFKVSEALRKKAEALSAADRSWAYISAQADMEAAKDSDTAR